MRKKNIFMSIIFFPVRCVAHQYLLIYNLSLVFSHHTAVERKSMRHRKIRRIVKRFQRNECKFTEQIWSDERWIINLNKIYHFPRAICWMKLLPYSHRSEMIIFLINHNAIISRLNDTFKQLTDKLRLCSFYWIAQLFAVEILSLLYMVLNDECAKI